MITITIKDCMEMYQTRLAEDIKAGKPWRYSNNGCSGTFSYAVKSNNRKANCATIANWALRDLKITKAGMYVYAGNDGIHWSTETEKAIRQKCYVIPVKGKTAKQCIEKGIMQLCDIVLHDCQHTNIYGGGDTWYDAGRGNCKNLVFLRWKCKKPGDTSRLAYLIRVHGDTLAHRVQINAFSSETRAKRCKAECKRVTGYDAFIDYMEDGNWHVFCGSFIDEAKAEERLKIVKPYYDGAFIKDVYV